MKIKNFYCDHCPKSFYVRQKMENHLKIHFNIFDIPCDKCDLSFRSIQTLGVHKKLVHENIKRQSTVAPEPCEICGKIFSSRQSCKSHYLSVHLKEKPNVCDAPGCGKRFVHKHELDRHRDTVHLNKVETCPICLKGFKTLSVHMKYKHKERRFECTFEDNGKVCGRKYPAESQLKRHVEVSHCGVRKHACEHCDRTFAKKEDLRGHTLNIHEKRKIQCELCPTLMGSKNYYTKHVSSHHRDLDPDFMEALLKKIRETPEEELFNFQK